MCLACGSSHRRAREHLAGIGDQTLQNRTNKRQAIIGERIPVNFDFFLLLQQMRVRTSKNGWTGEQVHHQPRVMIRSNHVYTNYDGKKVLL